MEVIFQDSIGFIYDVCRVIICKSNKRESWINAFLCDGSEEEDMLYIDNLLKKFQGIEISNKLLGYKNSKSQEALLGELYGRYLTEKYGEVEVEDFLTYISDPIMLYEAISEYYLNLDSVDEAVILEAVFRSKYSSEVKAELYSFFLFTKEYIENIRKEISNIIEGMKQVYRAEDYTINKVLKAEFQVDIFFKNVKEYMKTDTWEKGIKKYTVTFSFFNRYLVTRQIDDNGNGIIVLGIHYEDFFERKHKNGVDLVTFGNALGDKMRMKMVRLLCENGELTLTDFSNKLDIVNAVALYHLDILKEAKLILRRSEGRRVLYWLNRSQFSSATMEIKRIIEGVKE